jgi:hypothetical protein
MELVKKESESCQSSIKWLQGPLAQPGREAGYSPPSSATVKKAWNYTSTLPYVFMSWCLVKHMRLKPFPMA